MTLSQLCNVSSTVDALVESAFFAERLDESLTSLIRFTPFVQPYRYTSYEVSSSLWPTTMLFGCPLPDELDGASIGQRAVFNVFEMILMSTAKKHPDSLYDAICDAHQQQGDDTKLVECPFTYLRVMFAHVTVHSQHSNWNRYGTDLMQRNGGSEAVDYLAKAPSGSLLVVSIHTYLIWGTANNMIVLLDTSSYAISTTPWLRNQKYFYISTE